MNVVSPHAASFLRTLTLSTIAISVTLNLNGCSSLLDKVNEQGKVDYKSAEAPKRAKLEVPPDLSPLDTAPNLLTAKQNTSLSQYQNTPNISSNKANSRLLPATSPDIRMERLGNERWLVVNQSADVLWPQLKKFWEDAGFIIKNESLDLGILETDWAENRSKIPDGLIRNTIGRVLDNLFSSGEKDKFRLRLERQGSNGENTEIFISHQGVIEQLTSGKDSTVWKSRPSEPELEAEFLRRLMVALGTTKDKASAAVTQASTITQATLDAATNTIQLKDDFDRAWRRVGLALDRSSFTVEDRNRSKGIFMVRYVDPELDAAGKTGQKQGFFSNLFNSKDPGSNSRRYQVVLNKTLGNAGEATTVNVLTQEGLAERSSELDQIIRILHTQLQ
jgi:outer membrane protein assembly factor BamC